MARYNEILTGRYNRFLQKLFQMKGAAPAPQLAGDISIAMTLFNGVENRYLEGWNRYGQQVQVPAGGAGTFLHVRLRNPLTSNVIAVVEKIVVMNPAAIDTIAMQHGATNVDLASINVGISRWDSRSNPTGACVFSFAAVALSSFGGSKLVWQAPTNDRFDIIQHEDHEVTLLPGDAVQIQGGVANLNNEMVAYWWRERFLEESERT